MTIRWDLHISDVNLAQTNGSIMEGIIRFLYFKGNVSITGIHIYIPDESERLRTNAYQCESYTNGQ